MWRRLRRPERRATGARSTGCSWSALIALCAGRAGHARTLDGPRWLNVLVVLAMALPLLLRRTRPWSRSLVHVGRPRRHGDLADAAAGPARSVLMLVTATYSVGRAPGAAAAASARARASASA